MLEAGVKAPEFKLQDKDGNLEKEYLDECLFVPLLEGRE